MSIKFMTNPIKEKDNKDTSNIVKTIKKTKKSIKHGREALFLKKFTLALMKQYNPKPNQIFTHLKEQQPFQQQPTIFQPIPLKLTSRKSLKHKIPPQFQLPQQRSSPNISKRPFPAQQPSFNQRPTHQQTPLNQRQPPMQQPPQTQPQNQLSSQQGNMPQQNINYLLANAPIPISKIQETSQTETQVPESTSKQIPQPPTKEQLPTPPEKVEPSTSKQIPSTSKQIPQPPTKEQFPQPSIQEPTPKLDEAPKPQDESPNLQDSSIPPSLQNLKQSTPPLPEHVLDVPKPD